MDLLTERLVRSERTALDHDVARALSIGALEARRARRRERIAARHRWLRRLVAHRPTIGAVPAPPPATAAGPSAP